MTEQRSWSIPALPEQHLLPDVVVAFVDGELGATAHGRAAAHLGRCPMCAAELTVQRQARSAVRSAETPSVPAGLLASLRSIPTDTDLPEPPGGGLAVGSDGQLFAVQRPERAAAAFGSGAMLGSSAPLGQGSTVLRTGHGRRAVQGAGVVAAGLVLGALAVVGTNVLSVAGGPAEQPHPDGSTVAGSGTDVVAANFSTAVGGSVRSDTPATPSSVPGLPRAYAVRAH
jgi:anti-sigma factor RsiW